jgi:hypothetical protein
MVWPHNSFAAKFTDLAKKIADNFLHPRRKCRKRAIDAGFGDISTTSLLIPC